MLDKLKEAARERLAAEFAGATRQRVKRMLLDRLDETHRFEAPPSLVEEEFKLMWNSIKAEMESSGKTFADEDTTEEAAKEEYHKIADRRVRLGLVLSEIGEKNKITVTDDEVSRAVIERARQMPGREKEVWDYYRNNANALAQLRAPIYEDKVVDFILELANVTEKKVTREDLYKDDDAEKTRGLIARQAGVKDAARESSYGGGIRSLCRGLRKSASTAVDSERSNRLRPCRRANWPISVSSVLLSPASRDVRPRPANLACRLASSCRWTSASANPWVTNARSGRNLHEPRADGGRTDQPRRTRLRHLLAPAEGAHHLRDRPVEDGMSTLTVAQLLFLEAENPKKEISMYINSPGGVVTSGLAIYDTMQFIRPPVSTLCTGQAASMGSLLLAAGHKDMRFSLPNSRIMVHQPSGGFQGQATDIMLHAQEILNLKKRLNEIYVKHTGQTYKAIEDALERDKFLTAEMARDFGIVDKVIDKRAEEPTAKAP